MVMKRIVETETEMERDNRKVEVGREGASNGRAEQNKLRAEAGIRRIG